MLLRDRLQMRLREMGSAPDYVKLAEEVLSIRNAPPALARRLIEQALVVEDRRQTWIERGQRIAEAAPETTGVYVLMDAHRRPLYVGKAINLRRRLRTHFAARRWKAIKADLSRAENATWKEVGSELEALLLEAKWIGELQPTVNVQRADPSPDRPLHARYVQDVVVLLPSIDADGVEFVAARTTGAITIFRGTRDGRELAAHAERLWVFFHERPGLDEWSAAERGLAPLVFSWLAGRGATATRFELRDLVSADDLQTRLAVALASPQLFAERLVVRNSRGVGRNDD